MMNPASVFASVSAAGVRKPSNHAGPRRSSSSDLRNARAPLSVGNTAVIARGSHPRGISTPPAESAPEGIPASVSASVLSGSNRAPAGDRSHEWHATYERDHRCTMCGRAVAAAHRTTGRCVPCTLEVEAITRDEARGVA